MSNNRRRRSPGSQANARAAVGANGQFTFTHKGTIYTLPPAGNAAQKVNTGQIIDAILGDAALADVRIGFLALQAAGISDQAMNALRDMPLGEFGRIVDKWMNSTGADVGESQRSST